MKKKNPIDMLREKRGYLDNDLIEELQKDYDELIEEKDQQIDSIKTKLNNCSFEISDLFETLTFEQKSYLYLST
ncbi:hypothetical protein [Aquimarina algiphila]|uniref:Uncharacterized protein n=1 Tax=Aquimarina algiphila TaxID=2047982 RepID=A0A554VAD7_9FLAO|nr:hypothetical protein [Aquimarina algiphila]TSE03050.1 hypothetical protein FOF46_30155 [Aquimarina algiphila]